MACGYAAIILKVAPSGVIDVAYQYVSYAPEQGFAKSRAKFDRYALKQEDAQSGQTDQSAFAGASKCHQLANRILPTALALAIFDDDFIRPIRYREASEAGASGRTRVSAGDYGTEPETQFMST